jgi:hypothetical protein
MQVQQYWRRLESLARQVTDTEVRLQLPAQKTPEGRSFGIEGIVDIVREDDGRTTMYDIKTHEAALVKNNIDQYARQLNVYAHIWHGLRGNRLDATAVICTQLPPEVVRAHESGEAARLAEALAKWDPVIPITFDPAGVATTVRQFGAVVDKIESHQFDSPTDEILKARLPGTQARFAVYVCRNCDARFSCRSYQRHIFATKTRTEARMRQYVADLGDDDARDDFGIAALEIVPPLAEPD